MPVAYISLGSNLGDRAATITAALHALEQCGAVSIQRVSTILETDPVGGPPNQGKYLNAVAELATNLEPPSLLSHLLDIEMQLGRVRTIRFAPRAIDLDVLLFGDLVRYAPDPIVPHPRMHEREFVLIPLAEIAANVVHPVFGLTIAALLARLRRGWSHRLDGLRVMITGSTHGIGKAIAQSCANAGADVIVHGRRDGSEFATALAQSGRRSVTMQADLNQHTERERLMDEAWNQWQGLDVWINNAGADILTGERIHQVFEEKLSHLWEVDVRATILLSRAIGARMKSGGGTIINIGWDQSETGMSGDSAQLFGATKGAVAAFTKSLAVTLAPQVRVNCIAPGWIRTDWGDSAHAPWQQRVVQETPLRRWGLPQDVAATVVWLASPAAQFITGQVIRVNGGAVR